MFVRETLFPTEQPVEPQLPPSKIDKLSNELEKLVVELEVPQAVGEQELRSKVVAAVKQFRSSRRRLGEALVKYRAVWKPEGAWTKVCSVIARELKVSERTLYRVIKDYEGTPSIPDSVIETLEAEGIEPTAKRNKAIVEAIRSRAASGPLGVNDVREIIQSKASFADPRDRYHRLTQEERQVLSLREHLRKGLENVPPKRQMEVLRQGLNEFAWHFLRETSPFTLEVKPCKGNLTVDGRKPAPIPEAA